ncbi:MAG: A/G-specific adenine glycosylase [Planctomycetes bacterium]|nr:A/G-specific adenine glycosylase [Planctomycetota bacterium]
MHQDEASRQLKSALLKWYAKAHRAMPWRARPGAFPDAYHTLVSEAMLQQTQVATVIGYFERFVARWPTVAALAAADEQEVLHAWQGLGYYRRARHLHRAAKMIASDFDGRVPQTVDELLKLPGVGRYTAGAIASIAYGQPAALVDGNVLRVLGRIDAIDGDDAEAMTWRRAEALMQVRLRGACTAGDWNQALMELGALICTPVNPRCDACPVRSMCKALATDRVAELPAVRKRANVRAVTHRVVAIERNGQWLVRQRGDAGLWAGMWELPTLEGEGELKEWVHAATGLRIGAVRKNGGFAHLTTHRRIAFEVWLARPSGGRLRRGAGVWRRIEAMSDLAMSNPQRRALALLRQKAASLAEHA